MSGFHLQHEYIYSLCAYYTICNLSGNAILLLPSACSSILKKFVNYYLVESGTVHHYDFGEIIPDLQLVDAAEILIQSENILARQAQSPG